MNRHLALIVTIVAVVVGSWFLLRPNEHQKMVKAVEQMNATLPRRVDSVTTQTAVALDDHVVRNFYAVSQPIEVDGAIIVALQQAVRRQTCARPDTRALFAKGYSIDNVYAVTTRHGPDRMHVLVAPSDCG